KAHRIRLYEHLRKYKKIIRNLYFVYMKNKRRAPYLYPCIILLKNILGHQLIVFLNKAISMIITIESNSRNHWNR
ncbi:hypothetical protein OLG83_10540, partial [Streptococcus pneumoniae]|nr:hypothetical protein [Streptococcus pneumoniae]